MIDGLSARALDEIDARVNDLSNQFKPGYVPVLDEDRSVRSVHAVRSLDPLHAAAPEGAYYLGLDAQGRRFYSRDGAFALVDGHLRMPDGSDVIGYTSNSAGEERLSLLAVDPVDAALGRAQDPGVEADGSLVYSRSVVDPKTGKPKAERVVVGRVALARFPSGTQVDAADGVHVTAPAGVEPSLGKPNADGFGSLVTKMGDRGGIDMMRGLTHLRDAFLAYGAMQSAKNAHGKTDKIAMDLIK
jgi:flagellar basal body rod protein FlgG